MSQSDSRSQNSKTSNRTKALKYALPIAAFVLLVGGMSLWFASSNQQPSNVSTANRVQLPAANQEKEIASSNEAVTLTPAPKTWRETTHVHGLAVNPVHPAIAYIATHHGLLQRSQTGQWFWMGKQRADYMGFTADPTNPNRFYSSGHPPTGGNLGFQISDNQGQDWKQISLPGVDFHALAIAPSNPNRLVGK